MTAFIKIELEYSLKAEVTRELLIMNAVKLP